VRSGTGLARSTTRAIGGLVVADGNALAIGSISVGPGCRLVAGDVGDRLAELRSEFPGDIGVGGPTLASAFIERGLVDEYRIVVHPVILGAGTPLFPALHDRIGLRLLETHTFGSGVVYLGYETVR